MSDNESSGGEFDEEEITRNFDREASLIVQNDTLPKKSSDRYYIYWSTILTRIGKRRTARRCTRQPMGRHKIGQIPSLIAEILNLPNPNLYTGHCFRRTAATLLSESGATVQAIKQCGRWRSDIICQGYIENSEYNKELIFNGIVQNTKKANQVNPMMSVSSSCNPAVPSTSRDQTSNLNPIDDSNANLNEIDGLYMDLNWSDFSEEFQLHENQRVQQLKISSYKRLKSALDRPAADSARQIFLPKNFEEFFFLHNYSDEIFVSAIFPERFYPKNFKRNFFTALLCEIVFVRTIDVSKSLGRNGARSVSNGHRSSPTLSTLSSLSWDSNDLYEQDRRMAWELNAEDRHLIDTLDERPMYATQNVRRQQFSEPASIGRGLPETESPEPAVFSACGDLYPPSESAYSQSGRNRSRQGPYAQYPPYAPYTPNDDETAYLTCNTTMNNERDRFRQHEWRETEQQYAEQRRLEQRRTKQQAPSPKQDTVNVTDLVKLLMSYEERRDQRLRDQEEKYEKLATQFMQSPNVNSSAPTAATTAYHIVPDLSKDIRVFNGEESNAAAKEWLRGISSRRELHHWPDSYAYETARSHLRGGARHWLERKKNVSNWTSFKAAFTKTFIGVDSLTDAWTRMSARIQQKGEKISTYFHEKMKLCDQVKMKFDDAREQILVGLWSKELRNVVSPRNHRDDDELLHDLKKQQRIIQQSYDKRNVKVDAVSRASSPESKPNAKESKSSPTRNSDKDSKSRNAARKAPARNDKGELKCYACNLYGHISKDCPSKQSEKKSTQTSAQVKSNNSHSRDQHEVAKIDGVANDAAVKYCKEALLQGQHVKAFVDQGSSDCIITASTALELNLKIIKDKLNLHCYGPQEHQVQSIDYANCSLKIDGVNADNVPIRIVADTCQAIPLLVGRSYTELPHIKFMKCKNEFKFSYDTEQFPDVDVIQQRVVKSAENKEILPNSVNFINFNDSVNNFSLPIVNFSDQTTMLLQGASRGELCAAPALLSTSNQSSQETIS
ncbi:unnamed protein product [Trichogramma brassicae]|uniref:CCHC-type domain-containing protein n=1 Tax=Trichogramma brassicae TaxID=86971 RepID=A0A6H5IF41_9HYME|nr:unnamed protein product [Trichogramma brassicae]